jgi:hypothetical protein
LKALERKSKIHETISIKILSQQQSQSIDAKIHYFQFDHINRTFIKKYWITSNNLL